MPASYRRQAVIDAPVEEVWDLVGDPKRHPEWFPMVMEVSGLPSVETDATFRQVTRTVGGKIETTMAVEELDDLRQISLRCTDTGTYTRWWLDGGAGLDVRRHGDRPRAGEHVHAALRRDRRRALLPALDRGRARRAARGRHYEASSACLRRSW